MYINFDAQIFLMLWLILYYSHSKNICNGNIFGKVCKKCIVEPFELAVTAAQLYISDIGLYVYCGDTSNGLKSILRRKL